jgi:UDP-3-O-[3-hydroxymyristoyl] glucosamine N-acyltransferase
VGASSGVATNLAAKSVTLGTPAMERSKMLEIFVYMRRLRRLFDQFEEVKKRLNAIESGKKKG